MANQGCINGTLNGTNYSSPMPLIGLYVAVANLLCLLLMVHDVVVAILSRKTWLPSKLFGFNSATMTLLSVAVKLPVDITTSMPSPQDQLSKLAGTVLICISMVFLIPSLGVNSESERFTNMVGLSIFVITVSVNICIQIYTGVIVLFITEHIISLSFMLIFLVMLWYISYAFNGKWKFSNDQLNNLLEKGDSNMFERLKLCHLYAYSSDPQFKIGVHPMNVVVSTISLICAGILVQATIRSLILKRLEFCQGKSDYDWSVLIIIVIQVLTVIVGTVAIVFRWLILFNRMELELTIVSSMGSEELIKMRQTLRKELRLLKFFASLFTRIVSIVQLLIVFPWWLLAQIINLHKHEGFEFFGEFSPETFFAASWYIKQKSVDNLRRLKDRVYNRKSIIRLVEFLSLEHLQRANHLNGPGNDYSYYSNYCRVEHRMQVCSLSIALLVKIAEASIPNKYLGSLLRAFNEANEIVHFVDKKTQPLSSVSVAKAAYAKDLWTGGDFTCLLPDDIIGSCSLDGKEPGLDHAVARITKFKEILELYTTYSYYQTYSEVPSIVNFINRKNYSSVDDLVKSIEQMFADMMHTLLSQLPIAIFKLLRDGSADVEIEERVEYAMELVFQAKTLDGLIDWSFPVAGGFESFVELTVPRNLNEETSV